FWPLDLAPEANPAVLLNFAPNRLRDHRFAPCQLQIGSLAQDLLVEVPRRFQLTASANASGSNILAELNR
ncbi:MAG TPA: hypothetical protein VLV55_14865, partial [Rhizomicrobium sp.]|nr:hypothetical protein [Rhizomicrobium sp.]